jgi:two-component sensor histidine kinase
VKNNLQIIVSLLSLQSRFIGEEKLLNVFSEIQNRVRSMSLIHEKMYKTRDLSSVNIEEYITELSNSLIDTYRLSQQVKLDIEVGVNRFNADTLTPLGLIINEIISNALKYAFTEDKQGTIVVRLSRLNDEYFRMIIGDDGIGMDESEGREGSFGTELISALTEQLEGSIIRLTEEKGTVYQIDFKDVPA